MNYKRLNSFSSTQTAMTKHAQGDDRTRKTAAELVREKNAEIAAEKAARRLEAQRARQAKLEQERLSQIRHAEEIKARREKVEAELAKAIVPDRKEPKQPDRSARERLGREEDKRMQSPTPAKRSRNFSPACIRSGSTSR
jgi:hypothetical protein